MRWLRNLISRCMSIGWYGYRRLFHMPELSLEDLWKQGRSGSRAEFWLGRIRHPEEVTLSSSAVSTSDVSIWAATEQPQISVYTIASPARRENGSEEADRGVVGVGADVSSQDVRNKGGQGEAAARGVRQVQVSDAGADKSFPEKPTEDNREGGQGGPPG